VQSLRPVKSGSRFYLASWRLCSIIGCPGARWFSVLAVLFCVVLVSLLISLCIWEWVVAGCFYLTPLWQKASIMLNIVWILWLPPCGEWRTSGPYLAYWVMDLAGCLLMLCYCYLTMPWPCPWDCKHSSVCVLSIGSTIEGYANQVCLLGVHHRLDF
jgi:hypothetical protein